MINERLNILLSPVFVINLCLLLVNDFFLKPQFHNWATGKISDLSGLFVFPLLFFALCPRYKKTIYILTALLFCWWKSAHSQPVIDAWNAISMLTVSRVVDPSDLFALFALPLSYFYPNVQRRRHWPRLAALPIAFLSVFAFAATSFRTQLEYSSVYQFEESKIELTRRVHHLSDLNRQYEVWCDPNPEETRIKVQIPSDFCSSIVSASIVIGETGGRGTITLTKMEHRCPKGGNDQERLAAIFEREFVDKVREIKLESAPNYSSEGEPESSPILPAVRAGPLYLVAIGELPNFNLDDLARQLSIRHRLSCRVLPPIPLGDDLRQPGFPASRPVAAKLIEEMKRKHPEIAGNSAATMIAVTKDMSVSNSNRRYEFTYQSEGRFAVAAIDSLNPSTFCEPENRSLLVSRLQKVLAGDIGTLCYRLPPSDDPRSVMYRSTGCVHELDGIRNEPLISRGRRSAQ
jgi:hypothetical protein